MAFNWNPYTAPNMTQSMDNALFYRPADSKLQSGNDLYSFLTQDAAVNPASVTNRTVKYDGGLTREMLGNTTGFLNQQMGTGFEGIQNSLDQYAQYGGAFGDKNSPVYSPQSKNGYGSAWGNNNPFKIGSF